MQCSGLVSVPVLVNFIVSLLDTSMSDYPSKDNNNQGTRPGDGGGGAVGPVVQCSTLRSSCLALFKQSLQCRSSRSWPSLWTNQRRAGLAAVVLSWHDWLTECDHWLGRALRLSRRGRAEQARPPTSCRGPRRLKGELLRDQETPRVLAEPTLS